jgi:hypothetical protein
MSSRKQADAKEQVNHPPHYTWHPAGVEAVTVCEAFSYNLGNAIAYIWRSGGSVTKGEIETDLNKAVWYIQRELERIQNARPD